MNWSLLFSRIIISAIVLCVAYFFLKRIWTHEIDIRAIFEKPSERIPVKEGIFVKPVELDLTTKDWDKTRIFEIKSSKKENTVFSIWVKIWSANRDFKFEDFEILTETGKSFISESVGGITANYELVKINAFDPNDFPCIYLILYKLDPQESKLFKIKRFKSKEESEKVLKVSLKVMGYSAEAAPIASKENQAALMITPPEPMKVKAISFFLSRDDE